MIAIDTYLKTPTKCQQIINIRSVDDLLQHKHIIAKSPKRLIIGDTSNILFKQNFSGLVLKNSILGKIEIKQRSNFTSVKIPAGINWHELVKFTVQNDLWGIENLALIPGLVGSAPIQNIGAYGVELADCNPIVYDIDLHTMKERVFSTQECQFSYRDSIFKQQMILDSFFIHSLELQLSSNYQAKLEYNELQKAFTNKKPTQLEIMQEVCKMRQSKLPDPQQVPNLGSFFKNPIILKKSYEKLLSLHPTLIEIPAYQMTNESLLKLSAAALIEQSGLKGYKHPNGVEVSALHSLVLTNPKHKNGVEVMELAQFIQQSVKQKFGIDLETEVRII